MPKTTLISGVNMLLKSILKKILQRKKIQNGNLQFAKVANTGQLERSLKKDRKIYAHLLWCEKGFFLSGMPSAFLAW